MSRPFQPLAGLIAAGLLTAPLLADDLLTVGSTPGVYDFSDLQTAIDSATNGDTLYLFNGLYGSVDIDGKGLAIVGQEGAVVSLRSLTIRNLPADSSVELRDLSIQPSFEPIDSLVIEDCAGVVTLDQCRFELAKRNPLFARNAARIIASGCRFFGAEGTALTVFGDPPVPGFPGITLENSTAHLFDCTVQGGDGGSGSQEADSSLGGPGALLRNGSFLSIDGCWIEGGTGGAYGPLLSGVCEALGGAGGVVADPDCSLHERDSLVLGGDGTYDFVVATCEGPDGSAYEGVSPLIVPGASRPFDVQGVLFENISATLEFIAEPGDLGILIAGLAPSPLYTLACGGLAVTANLPTLVVLPPLDANGDLNFSLTPGPSPAGFEVEQIFLQGVFIDAGGTCQLGQPHVPTLFRCTPLPGEPDCNGNGLRDLCDVASGSSEDVNQNGIPDECE